MPKSIGRYTIVDRLAVGGMAELFKATLTAEHGFEKLVAIKKILPHLATDKSFVEMFIDEARITAQLDHRNIVQVFELGTDADTPYIAMQYVDGLDVLALLRECARVQIRLPPEIAAVIARDVCDALDYAHNAIDKAGKPLGIVHRDISPGNVLLSWRGDVKLTDFGIARAAERRHKTEAGTLKGKYGYMSPEQVSGGEIDPRSDIFSVGILLAEMVMARRLFTSTNDLDILLMVRDARLDRLVKYASEFPVELRVLTTKALQRRPEDRWQSAAEFRDALDEWIRRVAKVRNRDLASLIGKVINAPTADLEAITGGVVTQPTDDEAGLSGPLTRMSQMKAEAEAARARAAYIAGETFPVDPDKVAEIVVSEDDIVAEPVDVPSGPREVGDLRETSVLRVVYGLAKSRVSGLLSLEGRAGVLKEVYFAEGQPQFVNSNVESERLGNFLIQVEALTPQALQRALGVMHHFGGRLADTLVGLDILDPLEAYRLLAKQVAAKLMEAFSWQKGRYTWAGRHPNPWKARSLHLDAHRVIGAGAAQLGEALIDDWLNAHGRAFIVAEPHASGVDAELSAFGLGDALLRVYSLLDGRTRLAELAGRVRSPEARMNLLRLTYLLVETDLARLS